MKVKKCWNEVAGFLIRFYFGDLSKLARQLFRGLTLLHLFGRQASFKSRRKICVRKTIR